MADVVAALDVKRDIDAGISLISSPDWIDLTTFFEFARYDQPTTEARMRVLLHMEGNDPFQPEFTEAVSRFVNLETIAIDFDNTVVSGVLALADDIVHYQTIADTTYDRFADLVDRYDFSDKTPNDTRDTQDKLDALIALWAAGEVDGLSDKIKTRMASLLTTLATEASTRAQKAKALQDAILADKGISDRIQKCRADFVASAAKFDMKFGSEGTAIAQLRTSVASIEEDLTDLRKKERDEVIVLSTSPLYLAVPLIGPLILAGVDIGVGIDLAKVKATIASKVAELDALNSKISQDERFKTYYTTGRNTMDLLADRIATIVPKLNTLGLGWRAVASDIGAIASSLDGTGKTQVEKEDWFDLVTTIKTAQKNWKNVAARAKQFRSTAQPKRADSVDNLVEGAFKKAA